MPRDWDSMEFTRDDLPLVCRRRRERLQLTRPGAAPQTFMMLDIAALQHMYGADYTTTPATPLQLEPDQRRHPSSTATLAIEPGGNRILLTIWDGDGTDTYDLSNYTTEPRSTSARAATRYFSSGAARQSRRRSERRLRARQRLQRLRRLAPPEHYPAQSRLANLDDPRHAGSTGTWSTSRRPQAAVPLTLLMPSSPSCRESGRGQGRRSRGRRPFSLDAGPTRRPHPGRGA